MHLTTAGNLVLFGFIGMNFALTTFISSKLKKSSAARVQDDADAIRSRQASKRPPYLIPLVLALIAWCLAALFHWANWDPISHIPPATGRILFVAVPIVLAAALEGILVRARYKFVKRRTAESGSLSEKDIAGLKKIDAFIWKSSLFLAACIAVIALLRH